MHTIAQWISPPLIKATCWMLLHSLWQGLLAAALAGIIIAATRRAGARLRYGLLVSLFAVFLCGAAATFLITFNQAAAGPTPAAGGIVLSGVETVNDGPDFGTAFVQYFNRHAALVVLAWGIAFIAQLVKLMAEMHAVRRLRYRKTSAPAAEWTLLLSLLGNQLHIRKTVLLLQSELVQVPVTLGFLKPVILVPVGLLAGLPAEQVETILLHELAHIRRSDYLVNLLQSLAETIFFFNPGIRWIAALIREEREACCDDMVLQRTPQKITYLEALVHFEEQRTGAFTSAIAFTGNRHHLRNRIERMISLNNKTLTSMEKIFLGAGLIVTGLLMVAFTQHNPVVAKTVAFQPVYDTIPAQKDADAERALLQAKAQADAEQAMLRAKMQEDAEQARVRAKLQAEAAHRISIESKRKAEEMMKQNRQVEEIVQRDVAAKIQAEKQEAERSRQLAIVYKASAKANSRRASDEAAMLDLQSKRLAEQSKELAEASKRLAEESKRLAEQAAKLGEQDAKHDEKN